MTFLIISMITSACMVLTFKAFSHFNIPTFPALLSNYFTAGTWCVIYGTTPLEDYIEKVNEPWFPLTVFLGILFIGVFYATALTAQKVAVSVSIVAGKMSVVIPVLFAWAIYHSPMNIVTWIGIAGSLFSVILTTRRKEKSQLSGALTWIFPLIVFLGSGVVDTALNYLQRTYMKVADVKAPLALIFYMALFWGIMIFIGQGWKSKKWNFPIGAWLGGFSLGTLNYVSTFTLLKALDEGSIPATLLFPVANVGIVVLATLGAIIFFKEKLSKINYLGVALSILFILIIAESERIARIF